MIRQMPTTTDAMMNPTTALCLGTFRSGPVIPIVMVSYSRNEGHLPLDSGSGLRVNIGRRGLSKLRRRAYGTSETASKF
jgi:hypothetical protein